MWPPAAQPSQDWFIRSDVMWKQQLLTQTCPEAVEVCQSAFLPLRILLTFTVGRSMTEPIEGVMHKVDQTGLNQTGPDYHADAGRKADRHR